MLFGCVWVPANGGRVQPSVYDDDNFLMLVNDANDVEIAAIAASSFIPRMALMGVG